MGGGYKEERESRVIGTLMGYISEGNVLDVVDCFQVIISKEMPRLSCKFL